MNTLVSWFSQQLEFDIDLAGERCPGEEACEISFSGPLRRRGTRSILETCAGCNLRHTKPSYQPQRLLELIADTMELAEAKALGAVFQWPDGLTPLQWTALRALERARNEVERKQQKKAARQSEQQRVEGLVQRRA